MLIFPWQDRDRSFSWLKAGTLALMFAPAIWIVRQVATGEFGDRCRRLDHKRKKRRHRDKAAPVTTKFLEGTGPDPADDTCPF
jgi:hypothetical protein